MGKTNKIKTGISLNWMKTSLKDALPTGTHISPQVYTDMAQLIDQYLRKLIVHIVNEWDTAEVKRLTSSQVASAYFKMTMGDKE